MDNRKSFEITADGRHLYRPFGRLGATYELPDRAGYDRARFVNYGLIAAIFVIVIANIFHRNWLVTIVLCLGMLAVMVVWLGVNKARWTKVE